MCCLILHEKVKIRKLKNTCIFRDFRLWWGKWKMRLEGGVLILVCKKLDTGIAILLKYLRLGWICIHRFNNQL